MDGWAELGPGLAAGVIALGGGLLGHRGLVLLHRGWRARRHTRALLSERSWAHAVVVGREPGTVGARMADLRPVVRFTDPRAGRLTVVADLPMTRRPLAQPMQVGNLVTVAYAPGARPRAEIITAGSDGPVGGLMTSGMVCFGAGIVLLLCAAGTYLLTHLVLALTP